MNLFELVGCAAGIVGASAGGSFGHSVFGWTGAIVGVPVGAIGGWVAGIGVVSSVFFIGIVKERIQQRRRLRGKFGQYWSRDRVGDWETLVRGIEIGQAVEGTVVCQFYYGVFVDTGHGFPAVLLIGQSKGGIDKPQTEVGAALSARILEFDDVERFIGLTQIHDPTTDSRP